MSTILERKHSVISGTGTFALTTIKTGQFITTLAGEDFSSDATIIECVMRGISSEDALQVDDDTFLILTYEAKVINHSCDPNAGLRNKSDLYAIKPIKKGEEITYDYSCTVGVENEYHLFCRCGAKTCRTNVGNVLSIPKQQLLYYAKHNALPAFIVKQLKRIGYLKQPSHA